MFGRSLRKAFGASIKGKDLFFCRTLLWSKYVRSTIFTTERIGDIGGYREANVIQFAHIIPFSMLGNGCD